MKTLVIHPKDHTTDFLTPVWEENHEWTVVRSNSVSKSELRRQIKQHDRIVCMGHGCEEGLFRVGKYNSLMIDSTFVQLLREKDCVFVWCNSDVFFRRYGLRGFFTGMIISEAEEALYCCVPFSLNDIKNANEKLAEVLKEAIHHDSRTMYHIVKDSYIPESNVEFFNLSNIYHRNDYQENT
jgi:hypothetical protein